MKDSEGKYIGWTKEIQYYVQELMEDLSYLKLGSDILYDSLGWAGSIGWQPSRPSTLANVLVYLIGSANGVDTRILMENIIATRLTTKQTLDFWIERIRGDLRL